MNILMETQIAHNGFLKNTEVNYVGSRDFHKIVEIGHIDNKKLPE